MQRISRAGNEFLQRVITGINQTPCQLAGADTGTDRLEVVPQRPNWNRLVVDRRMQHRTCIVRQRDAVVRNRQAILDRQIPIGSHVVDTGQHLIQAVLEVPIWLNVLAEYGDKLVDGSSWHGSKFYRCALCARFMLRD